MHVQVPGTKGLRLQQLFGTSALGLPHPHAYLPLWLGPELGTGGLSLPYCGLPSLKLSTCRVYAPFSLSPTEPPYHIPAREFPLAPSSPTGPPIMSTVHVLGSRMIFMNAGRGLYQEIPHH